MGRWIVALSALALTVIACAWLAIFKIEVPAAFKQVAAHDQIDVSATLGPFNPPGQYWKSQTSFQQVADPTDSVAMFGTMQHLVRIDPGDPVPGSPVRWVHSFTTGTMPSSPLQVFYKILDHGEGFDAMISVSAIKSDGIRHISVYSNIQAGRHYTNSLIDQLRGFFAPLEGTVEEGNLSVILLNKDSGDGVLVVGLAKILRSRVHGGKIRLGPNASLPGHTVYSLPPGSQWESNEGGCVYVIDDPRVLTAFGPDLAAGNVEVVVDYDDGTVAGSFQPAPLQFSPVGFRVTEGEHFDGDAESLEVADQVPLTTFNDPVTLRTTVEMSVTLQVGGEGSLRLITSGSRPGLIESYEVFFGTWITIGGATLSVDYAARDVPIPGLVPVGDAVVRLTCQPVHDEDPAQDGWLYSIDHCDVQVTNRIW